MVGDRDVPGPERQRLPQPSDAQTERPEMDRDVRRVDDQLPGRVEQRAGEIEPLLDVGRDRGAPQPLPHVQGDGAKPVGEQLEPHRLRAVVGGGVVRCAARGAARDARVPSAAPQDESAGTIDFRIPAVLDDRRGVRLENQRRAGQPRSGLQPVAIENRRFDEP